MALTLPRRLPPLFPFVCGGLQWLKESLFVSNPFNISMLRKHYHSWLRLSRAWKYDDAKRRDEDPLTPASSPSAPSIPFCVRGASVAERISLRQQPIQHQYVTGRLPSMAPPLTLRGHTTMLNASMRIPLTLPRRLPPPLFLFVCGGF